MPSGQAARRQGLRPPPLPPRVPCPRHQAPHCSARHGQQPEAGTTPLGGRAHPRLAEPVPAPDRTLRATRRPAPRPHHARLRRHLPAPGQTVLSPTLKPRNFSRVLIVSLEMPQPMKDMTSIANHFLVTVASDLPVASIMMCGTQARTLRAVGLTLKAADIAFFQANLINPTMWTNAVVSSHRANKRKQSDQNLCCLDVAARGKGLGGRFRSEPVIEPP